MQWRIAEDGMIEIIVIAAATLLLIAAGRKAAEPVPVRIRRK